MKTIEEKAKAYDRVLEIAKAWRKLGNNDLSNDDLETLFPELRELEDEKVRKELIENFIDSLEEESDCIYNHMPNNHQITIGTKIRLKTNPNIILSIISNDCHEDEFECSNGSVLSLKQIEKYYDIII